MIFNNPLYNTLYIVVLTLLFLVSVVYIFSIHFILLDEKPVLAAFRSSRLLMKKYWQKFIVDYFLKLIKITLIFAAIGFATVAVLFIIDLAIGGYFMTDNIAIIVLIMSIFEAIEFITFIMMPIAITILTKLFFKHNGAEGKIVKIKLVDSATELTDNDIYEKIRIKTKAEIAIIIVLVLAFKR